MESTDIVIINSEDSFKIVQDWSSIKIYRISTKTKENIDGIPSITIPMESSEKAKIYKDGLLLGMRLTGKEIIPVK